jgi:hypothetical protein
MSITANYIGSLDFAAFFACAAAPTKADAYTVDAGNRSLTLASFSFANDTGSAVQCKLYYYDSQNATEHLVWTGSVGANSTGPDLPKPVRLGENDKIRAVANTSVTLHMNFLFQLETRPS